MRSASEKSVSPLSNSLPRGPRESASMPIMLPVARSKTGWKTGWMSRREMTSWSSSPPRISWRTVCRVTLSRASWTPR